MDKNILETKDKKLKVVDRRRVGRDEDAPSSEPNLKPTYVEQLENKVARMESALKEKLSELEEDARRSRARVEADLEKRFEERLDSMLEELLDVAETIDRAVEMSGGDPSTREGLQLLSATLERFLEKRSVRKFAPKGEEFDPNLMEAMQAVPGPKNTVVEVYQNGYLKGDKVLKAARVVVGSGE